VFIKCLFASLFTILFMAGAPFIGFGKSYDKIIADAARAFGINEGEYEVHFTKTVVNAKGEEVSGTFNVVLDGQANGIYTLHIQKSYSRTFTVGVIYHEFAHAAQHKYYLSPGNYSKEQHAELLAFNALWHSKNWWNAVHMISLHTWHAKPKDYLVPREIWKTTLTGINTVPAAGDTKFKPD